jgi:hypothetical protein
VLPMCPVRSVTYLSGRSCKPSVPRETNGKTRGEALSDARLSAPGLCVTPTLGAGLASHARTGTLFKGAGRRMRLDSDGS